MSAEENMALARRFLTALVKGDLETMDEMMAPDYVSHTPFLPEQEPGREGVLWAIAQVSAAISDVSVLFDFYDFHLLNDGRLGLVVGDATGKGVPAALMMSTTCGMLQLAARSVDAPSPGGVLSRVNEALIARIPPNMFVTCFYAVLDPRSGSLSYANAGHDIPYLHRRNGEIEELRARGMPLGLMPGMGYEEKEATLAPGEGVLFYSDGMVEAQELYSFVGVGWEQEDDITLLALKRSAIRSRTYSGSLHG